MRIEQIYVDGYGALYDAKVELAEGLVCVQGANEAGKSTLLAFVRSILFGFSQALTRVPAGGRGRARIPYDPIQGQKGGHLIMVLEEDGHESRYLVRRLVTGAKEGELTVEEQGGGRKRQGPEAERFLQHLLGGADATLFSNVFAIGLDELHDVASLDSEAVESVLFTGGAGIGTDLVPEMENIRKAHRDLYLPKGRKPTINTLQGAIRDTQQEIRQANSDLRNYQSEREELDILQNRIEELESEREDALAEAARAEKRQQARKHLGRINQLEEQAASLRELRLPDEAAVAEEERLHAAVDKWEGRVEDRRVRRDELTSDAEAVTFENAAADAWEQWRSIQPDELDDLHAAATNRDELRDRIGDLLGKHVEAADREAHQKLAERRANKANRLEELVRQRDALLHAAGKADEEVLERDTERRIAETQRIDLRGLEQQVETATDRLRTAEAEAQRRREATGGGWTEERVQTMPTDPASLAALKQALPGDLGTNRMASRAWKASVALGFVLTIVGAGLLVIETLSAAVVFGTGVIVLIMGFLQRPKAVAVVQEVPAAARKQLATYGFQAAVTRSDFEAFIARLDEAKRAIGEVKQARGAHRHATGRLQEAEKRVQAVAEVVGIDPSAPAPTLLDDLSTRLEASRTAVAEAGAKRRAVEEVAPQIQTLETDLEKLAEEMNAIRSRYGQPVPSEEPFQVLCQASEERDHLRHELDKADIAARRYDALRPVLKKAASAMGETWPPDGSLTAAAGRLKEQSEEAHEARQRRRDLDKQVAAQERKLKEAEVKLETHQEAWGKHVEPFGCESHAGFQESAERRRELKGLLEKIDDERGHLEDLASGYPDLEQDTGKGNPAGDDALIAGKDERAQEFKDILKQERDRHQELRSSLDRLDSSDDLGMFLAKRKALEAELDQAKVEWARLRLTEHLLQHAREVFEREHGPEVLKSASDFLARITDGRYVSIQRQADGTGYELESPTGRRIPARPPMVSRATFAQVYLCVRLAYTNVSKEHAHLPYVLDDVLSDFDEERLRRAAEVLHDLGGDRQVVLLTHHAHVAEACQAAGGTVHRLSPRTTLRVEASGGANQSLKPTSLRSEA